MVVKSTFMHDSKLIRYLKILDEAELKRLLYFLKSPFYNANPHILKLYMLLRPEHPGFSSPKLTRERLFKKLFRDRAYDHQKMLNLMSDFTQLLEKYMIALQLEKEEDMQDQLLLTSFGERPEGYAAFEKTAERIGQKRDALPYRDTGYYRRKFQLEQQYFNHPATDKFELSKDRYDDAMEQLDRWFILEKLLLSCEMKAREKPLSEEYEIWLLPEIRAGLPHYPMQDAITGVYLEMLDLLEKEEPDSYYRLKALFMENLTRFTRQQQQNVLQSLINYTIREGNRGNKPFLQENLALYRLGLESGLFQEGGLLNDMVYISVVNVANRAGETAWCGHFIRDFEPALEQSIRKDASALARALWLYASQKPEETMALLQKVEFLNIYYQIQARVLMIKVCFEAFRKDDHYQELVVSLADAFRQFLRRNKRVSRSQKEALLNFALCVGQLAKWRTDPGFDRQKRVELKQEWNSLTPLYNKTWILQQTDR